MSEHWLDDLARAMAGQRSRRAVLRRLGAGLAATVVAAAIPGAVAAHHDPEHDRGCIGGCPSPEDRCCKGRCTNVVFDRANCGRCGNVCPAGSDCCGGRCVQLGTQQHCSGCFSGCLSTEVCQNGACVAA